MKVKPFLGRMKVEVIMEDTQAYMKEKIKAESGASAEFLDKFELVLGENKVDEYGQSKFEALKARKQINRGKIIEMSPDCFGKAFQERFGSDRDYPKLGDIVMFVPNKSYQVDAENKYHIVDDCDVVGYVSSEDIV